MGREDEATLASTSVFSTALIRWHLWRREASVWPFFQTVPLQGQLRHQLLQLYVLSLELVYLLLSGVPHRVPRSPSEKHGWRVLRCMMGPIQ